MKRYFFQSILLILLLISCSPLEGKGKQKINAYYTALGKGDYPATLDHFSENFFNETSRQEWRQIQDFITARLGKCLSWKNLKNNFTAGGAQFQYRVTYEKGESVENILLSLYGENLLIDKFHIRSEALEERE